MSRCSAENVTGEDYLRFWKGLLAGLVLSSPFWIVVIVILFAL